MTNRQSVHELQLQRIFYDHMIMSRTYVVSWAILFYFHQSMQGNYI